MIVSRPLYEKFLYKIVRETNDKDEAFKVGLVSDSESSSFDAVLNNNDWLIKSFDQDQFTKPEHVNALFTKVQESLDREQVWSISLDKKCRILGINLVAIGTASQCLVHPKFVYKLPLLQNAEAVILVHNHPSGDPTPSTDDYRLTLKIENAGKALGIVLFDHVVLGANHEFSSIMSDPKYSKLLRDTTI